MPDSPATPAIRERQTKAQAALQAVADSGHLMFRASLDLPDDTDMLLMAVVREDVPALLSLVARLQGERDSLRDALNGLQTYGVKGAPCWCDEEWLALGEGHALYCLAARAALGEEE